MTDKKPNEKLKNLVELSVAFKNAVEQEFGKNAAVTAKVRASVTAEEMSELQSLAMQLAAGGLGAAFGGIDDEFLKLNLKAADVTADIAGRAIEKDELVKLLPEELASEENVKALEANEATYLANLCKHKLSL